MKSACIFPGWGVLFFLALFTLGIQTATVPTGITVKLLGEAELKGLLESSRDQVMVVNVWATWCKPCREEFPDLIRLHDFYRDKKVRVVAISADYPDEIESKILPFLKKFAVNFPVYVQNFSKQEDFIDGMNREWSGALPATFIYNAEGRQQAFFIGKRDFASFRREIDKIRSMR
jgi:thiol-disulfide isomerase/thioredoxin